MACCHRLALSNCGLSVLAPSVLAPSILALSLLTTLAASWAWAAEPATAPLQLPLGRTAYFSGESIPLAFTTDEQVTLEAISADGRITLYSGPARPLILEAALLAPGDYQLEVNGQPALERLSIVSTQRPSAASLQDESAPRGPSFDPQKQYSAAERAAVILAQSEDTARTLRESGLTAAVVMGSAEQQRADWLDDFARAAAVGIFNPDTRPTSFFPIGNSAAELDSMSQRMIHIANSNRRYPNFAGFCFGWDTTGFNPGGRKGLMTYWSWGERTADLRRYIERWDEQLKNEFTRRTGFEPVSEKEYISYLLAIRQPEFAPMIDLPTRHWLADIARHSQPMGDAERASFERRLDAWSAYLMGQYGESFQRFQQNLRETVPGLRNTASVQIDHAAVRYGQYLAAAYEPLDYQYQTTWNDQVGGPDYVYQWLLTQALLDTHLPGRPTWISNTMGPVHARADYPGKLTRVAAHGLAHQASGVGFALEGFSNLLNGMNPDALWGKVRDAAGGADVRAGKDFLDRFAGLALAGQGDHGVGVLIARSQLQRQHLVQGFGTTYYKALVALTRLGYTPRFVTEEDLLQGNTGALQAILAIGLTVELPAEVQSALAKFQQQGGWLVADESTTVALPNVRPLPFRFPVAELGKPHSWSSPNFGADENDTDLAERWLAELAGPLVGVLGDRGRGVLRAEQPTTTQTTLMQLDAGGGAKFVVAVNDSHVATQADWTQLRERLLPTDPQQAGVVYDVTAEKLLGPLAPLDCDLTATTARVFAILPRAITATDLAATQRVAAGGELVVSARFVDEAGQTLAAVLPLHLQVQRPDGGVFRALYRTTDRSGQFAVSVPLPANVPAGRWFVRVRSQLTGIETSLPIEVTPPVAPPKAAVWDDPVIARDEAAIDAALAPGAKIVLPIFDSPAAEQLAAGAERLKAALAERRVELDVRRKPEISTYTLAYDLNDSQRQQNAEVEQGRALGKINRITVNLNDWFAGHTGWHFGQPLILLDDVTVAGDNPLAEALYAGEHPWNHLDMLWPQVTPTFPGRGRCVVQAVPWAFAPRQTAIVIQAAGPEGLVRGLEALVQLPADRLSPGILAARTQLWRERHVGGTPATPDLSKYSLTQTDRAVAPAARPFAIQFPDKRPPAAGSAPPRAVKPRDVVAIPGLAVPKQCMPLLRADKRFVEAATPDVLLADLRFSDGMKVLADVERPGATRIAYAGTFRYSDRAPCWQAQWEDLLALHDKVVPKRREQPEIEVLIGGQTVGHLTPVKTAERKVPLELSSPSAGQQPRTVVEEVVVVLAGEIALPPGRQEIVFVPHNIVDGVLTSIGLGVDATEPEPQVKN